MKALLSSYNMRIYTLLHEGKTSVENRAYDEYWLLLSRTKEALGHTPAWEKDFFPCEFELEEYEPMRLNALESFKSALTEFIASDT